MTTPSRKRPIVSAVGIYLGSLSYKRDQIHYRRRDCDDDEAAEHRGDHRLDYVAPSEGTAVPQSIVSCHGDYSLTYLQVQGSISLSPRVCLKSHKVMRLWNDLGSRYANHWKLGAKINGKKIQASKTTRLDER